MPAQITYQHSVSRQHVSATLARGAAQTIRITPTQPGRYVYYCGSPGHQMAGMEGVLIVDP